MLPLLVATLLPFRAEEQGPPIALVLTTRGTVTVARAGDKPHPLGPADLLRPGDRLEAEVNSDATLAWLSDGHRERLRAKARATVREKGCTPADAVEPVETGGTPSAGQLRALRLHFQGGDRGAVGLLRGEDVRPQVVTPMYGARVLSDHPTLSWPAVAGAEGYEVVILSGAEGPSQAVLWRAATKETRLPYPEEEKVLTPGLKYRWRVLAQRGNDREEEVVDSKFFVASTGQMADLARVKRLASSDDPGDWLLAAAIYEARGVYDKALPLYEKLARHDPSAVNYQRALARYYERAGRKDRAKEAAERAKKLGAVVPMP
jgi:hypothetical protein